MRQRDQITRHILCAAEKPRAMLKVLHAIGTQRHRNIGGLHQTAQQLALGGIEGVKFIHKNSRTGQILRHKALGCHLYTIPRVHGRACQKCLVGGKNQRQLLQFFCAGACLRGQLCQLLAADPGAFQFIDGFGCHAAKCDAAAVTAIILHLLAQAFHRAAHQYGTARIRNGGDGRAAIGLQNMLGQTAEGIAVHISGKRISQRCKNAFFGAGGELLRHQQKAFLPLLCAALDLPHDPAGFSAAGNSQNQLQHIPVPPACKQ